MTTDKSSVADNLQSLYKGRVDIEYLQAKLLSASIGDEVGGPTPPQDQQIQKTIYNYLQSDRNVSDGTRGSFPVVLAWICVGRELAKFLALAPKASLSDLMQSGKEAGFDVEAAN